MDEPLLTLSSTVRLDDGRRLAFSSTGTAAGFPVLYFHGAIGSPVSHSAELRAAIGRLGIRFVVVHRPGFGASDPLPGRTVATFAADVRRLAEALGLTRFGLVGVSAGAPYALACAREMPERLTGVAAVACQAPGTAPHSPGAARRVRLGLALVARAPATATRTSEACLRLARHHPGLLARAMRAGASGPDRAALGNELGDPAARALAAFAGGTAPMIEDYLVCCGRWGFDPAEVRAPVWLWHGERDPIVPLEHARRLAQLVPGSRLEVEPGAGHFFLRRRLGDVLEPLLPAGREALRAA